MKIELFGYESGPYIKRNTIGSWHPTQYAGAIYPRQYSIGFGTHDNFIVIANTKTRSGTDIVFVPGKSGISLILGIDSQDFCAVSNSNLVVRRPLIPRDQAQRLHELRGGRVGENRVGH